MTATEDAASRRPARPGDTRFILRRAPYPAALPAVVGASTLLHWLAGRRLAGLWIMPDEAIYAERALAFWRHGSLPLLHGQGAGYGVLYPILAGFPFSVGSFTQGYASLKLLQALVVSLAAVPVFAYGRRLMPPGYALLAATLTVASPLLLYSGLVMTEVLFYPLAALTLVVVARAVETGAKRHQALAFVLILAAVLTRVQAVVFVAVFAGAILVDALLARERSRLRAFWPTWLVLAIAAVAAAAAPGLFGSYAGTLRGSYPLGHALGLTFDHASYLVLSTGIVPAFALVLLLPRARDPASRALVAVTLCATVLVVVQVGFFAARYSPHLLGRDLAALPPLLFLTLSLWIARGAPRTRAIAAPAAFGVLCVLLLAPWDRLVGRSVLPDTFGLEIVNRVHSVTPASTIAIVGVTVLAACVVLPRRLALALPLGVLALLGVSSVVASNEIEARVSVDQAKLVGPSPDWIDRAADGGVTYLYDGEPYWNGVWQERFWNHRVDRVVSIRPARVPGPIEQTEASVPPDGRLPSRDRYVVATDVHTFVGTPVAHLAQTGVDVSGLTLWRLEGPPSLSTATSGVQPNGDMSGPATVDVYDCRRGRLELTLLPKSTETLRILLNERPVLQQAVGGLPSWHGSIAVPPSSTPRICRFTILGGPLLGSTRIAFVRG